ncbi:hypothetical protein KKF84_15310, partial [Myxococcota bacterium]|nr:hypothetical protein [Myxococcota bacterium]
MMKRVGYVQFSPKMFQFEENMERAWALLEGQMPASADLLVFPELALTGYAYGDQEALARVSSEQHNALTVAFAQKVATR